MTSLLSSPLPVFPSASCGCRCLRPSRSRPELPSHDPNTETEECCSADSSCPCPSTCIPIPLYYPRSLSLSSLLPDIFHYQLTHGILLHRDNQILPLPLTLYPSALPRSLYSSLASSALLFNELYDRVARDFDFLSSSLSSAAASDPFLNRLIDLARTVHREGIRQPHWISVNRSDYLTEFDSHSGNLTARQVEFNAISAGLGALSSQTSNLHRFILERHGNENSSSGSFAAYQFPVNDGIERIPAALAQGHTLFTQSFVPQSQKQLKVAILFVVQPNEWNLCDQEHLKDELWQRHGIPAIRKTLEEISQSARLDAATNSLIVTQFGQEYLISLCYFRAGYSPQDFLTPAALSASVLPGFTLTDAHFSSALFSALLTLERSTALKCPNVFQHLSGTKKIQQLLVQHGPLTRFTKPSKALNGQENAIQTYFTAIYSLESKDFPQLSHSTLRDLLLEAIHNSSEFVLKPQREGGGNNLWGTEMVKRLKAAMDKIDGPGNHNGDALSSDHSAANDSLSDLSSFVLMKRIAAPEIDSAGIRAGKVEHFSGISEYGIFGVSISHLDSSTGQLVFDLNSSAGYLVRTKMAEYKEGGISCGAGFIDSLVLVEGDAQSNKPSTLTS